MTSVVGLGLPSHNGIAHLEQAVASLRAQTYDDFVLACVDDASSDGTPEALERHAVQDPRIVVRRQALRRGLAQNWRAAFALARETNPGMRYFAWVSDHDVWDPRWLEVLVAELEAHPEAVLAYPLIVGIDEDGERTREPARFDTAGLTDPHARLVAATRGMKAGNLVYGLYRADALERCGIFPQVIVPDRLLLTRLALVGEFRQVREELWSRRYGTRTMAIRARQQQTLFPDGVPFFARLPWWLVHGAVLARRSGLRPAAWYTGHMGRAAFRKRRTRSKRGRAAR